MSALDEHLERVACLSEGFCPEHRIPLRMNGACREDGARWLLRDHPVMGPNVIYKFPADQARRVERSTS